VQEQRDQQLVPLDQLLANQRERPALGSERRVPPSIPRRGLWTLESWITRLREHPDAMRVFCSRTKQVGCYGGGGEESTGTSKPIVEVKNVSQSGWSKSSVAFEGLMVQKAMKGASKIGHGPCRC
jgi:hypothetical protein